MAEKNENSHPRVRIKRIIKHLRVVLQHDQDSYIVTRGTRSIFCQGEKIFLSFPAQRNKLGLKSGHDSKESFVRLDRRQICCPFDVHIKPKRQQGPVYFHQLCPTSDGRHLGRWAHCQDFSKGHKIANDEGPWGDECHTLAFSNILCHV